jgi:acetyl-CoA carboxylase biotin carboxylase subunit
VYAEDPARGFLPSPGRIEALRVPGGPGVRDDSGVYEGWLVPVEYDPLISKLATWGEDRAEALARMRRALAEYQVIGVKTTLPFFARVLDHPAFIAGDYDTSFVERAFADGAAGAEPPVPLAVAAAAIRAFRERQRGTAEPASAGAPSAWWQAGVREALRG